MLMVAFQEGKPPCASVYQASAFATFAAVLLVKESHMAKSRAHIGATNKRVCISGSMINWDTLINSVLHKQYRIEKMKQNE